MITKAIKELWNEYWYSLKQWAYSWALREINPLHRDVPEIIIKKATMKGIWK